MNFTLHKLFRLLGCTSFFLCQSFIGTGQEDMAQFLDSLEKHSYTNFESTVAKDSKIKALLKRIDTTEHSLQQIEHILAYSAMAYDGSDFEFYAYLVWANNTIQPFNKPIKQAEILTMLGLSIHTKQPHKELEFYKQAKAIYEVKRNLRGIIYMNKRIGLWHYSQKRYDRALEFQFRNMEIHKANNNNKKLLTSYHNIGDTYMRIFDVENAIKYLKMSSELEEKFPNQAVHAMNLSFLGELYLAKDSVFLAKNYLEKATTYIQQTEVVPYLVPDNLMHLGIIEETCGNKDLAYAYYKKAFELAYPALAAKRSSLLIGIRMASLLLAQKEPQKVVSLLTTILEKRYHSKLVPMGILSSTSIIEFYQILARAYEQMGETKKATLAKTKELETWRKSSTNETLLSFKKIENKYQAELAEKELKVLQDEKELSESQFLIGIICFISITAILLLLTVFFKQRFTLSKRKEAIIELALQNEKSKSIELENENKIAALEFELKKKSIITDLRNKISADLHDEVGTVLTGLAMQSEILEQKAPKENQEKLNRISTLSRKAMLGMRDSVWAMNTQKDFSSSLVDRISEFANEQLENTNISFEIKTDGIDNTTALSGDIRHHLNLICKEALTNVLKHANATAIGVYLKQTEKLLTLEITDNGTVSTKTNGKTGAGICNMKKRAAHLKGTFALNTTNGFSIVVTIPV